MRIGNFSIWTTERDAASYGCTHHARFLGLVPGFIGGQESEAPIWVSRSDALNLFEDAVAFVASLVWAAKDMEPVFSFSVGKKIAG